MILGGYYRKQKSEKKKRAFPSFGCLRGIEFESTYGGERFLHLGFPWDALLAHWTIRRSEKFISQGCFCEAANVFTPTTSSAAGCDSSCLDYEHSCSCSSTTTTWGWETSSRRGRRSLLLNICSVQPKLHYTHQQQLLHYSALRPLSARRIETEGALRSPSAYRIETEAPLTDHHGSCVLVPLCLSTAFFFLHSSRLCVLFA
jgi:hypothetical protein